MTRRIRSRRSTRSSTVCYGRGCCWCSWAARNSQLVFYPWLLVRFNQLLRDGHDVVKVETQAIFLVRAFAVAAMLWLLVLLSLGSADPLTRTEFHVPNVQVK